MAPNRQVILQKFYIYDPGVHIGDEFGGLRVMQDEKKNGDKGEGDGKYILAMPQMVQWWFDQGLVGREPLSKLSGPGKKLLAQITRGRSEKPDDDPKRVPRYSRQSQSGSPAFALSSPAVQRSTKRQKDRLKDKQKGGEKNQPKRPAPTPTTPA